MVLLIMCRCIVVRRISPYVQTSLYVRTRGDVRGMSILVGYEYNVHIDAAIPQGTVADESSALLPLTGPPFYLPFPIWQLAYLSE